MKKLIAIATAFVMTLTMTSAMASFNWTNPTVNRTGKATVEVVPYVKTSDGAGGFIWKASKYAAAVSSENVYFAVKLTVAPNPDPRWISNAAVELEATGLTSAWVNDNYNSIPLTGVDAEASGQTVYYLTRESAESNNIAAAPWTKVDKSFTVADDVEARDSLNIFTVPVYNSNKAKLCATLTSSFGTGSSDFTAGDVGEYYVTFAEGFLTVYADEAASASPNGFLVRYTIDPSTEKVSSVTNQAGSTAPYDYGTIRAFFNIDMGTRINQKLVNANFGWSDEIENCFKWGGTVAPTPGVDTSIPKTGGPSVLAYGLMAVLAAAGAIMKK